MRNVNKLTTLSDTITNTFLLLPFSFLSYSIASHLKRRNLFNPEISMPLRKLKLLYILPHFHYLQNGGSKSNTGKLYIDFKRNGYLHKAFGTFEEFADQVNNEFVDNHVDLFVNTKTRELEYTIKDQYYQDSEGSTMQVRINACEVDTKSYAVLATQVFFIGRQYAPVFDDQGNIIKDAIQTHHDVQEMFLATLQENNGDFSDTTERRSKRRNIMGASEKITAATFKGRKGFNYIFETTKRSKTEVFPMGQLLKEVGVKIVELASLVANAAKQAAKKALKAAESTTNTAEVVLDTTKGFTAQTLTAMQTVSNRYEIERLVCTDGIEIDYDNQIPF
ncbi:hypothetical protein [Vibrio harveyi]|uniref:hypothetical protein n=1 Tax=Vibrio harveyi TaxID=669 RepID=UPI002380B4E2|nr:hypothetical protein [Vibrio harveyi]